MCGKRFLSIGQNVADFLLFEKQIVPHIIFENIELLDFP